MKPTEVPVYSRISRPVSIRLDKELKKVKRSERAASKRLILEAALLKFYGLPDETRLAAVRERVTAVLTGPGRGSVAKPAA